MLQISSGLRLQNSDNLIVILKTPCVKSDMHGMIFQRKATNDGDDDDDDDDNDPRQKTPEELISGSL
mgnify:CR=1 FL=1